MESESANRISTNLDTNPFALAQNNFENALIEIADQKKVVFHALTWRTIAAYAFKATAVFGGIAVTAGVSEETAHAIGVAIAVAVAIDGLFVNHTRLLALSKANSAYKFLLKDVRNDHQSKLVPILVLKGQGADKVNEAMAQLIELNLGLKQHLDTESRKIEQALSDTDIKSLNQLSLDNQRKADNPNPS